MKFSLSRYGYLYLTPHILFLLYFLFVPNRDNSVSSLTGTMIAQIKLLFIANLLQYIFVWWWLGPLSYFCWLHKKVTQLWEKKLIITTFFLPLLACLIFLIIPK